MNVNIGTRFSLATWASKVKGDVDPGLFGTDWGEDGSKPLDFNLDWRGGMYKSVEDPSDKEDSEGIWYCLFFSMDAGESYRLRVQTSAIPAALSKGIILTAGFASADQYREEDEFGIYHYYDDSPVVSGETIANGVALSDSNFTPAYNDTAYSWLECQTGQVLYRNTTAGITRIARCYVSVFDYFASWDSKYAGQQQMIADGRIAPITAATPGTQPGTITFTMEPNG